MFVELIALCQFITVERPDKPFLNEAKTKIVFRPFQPKAYQKKTGHTASNRLLKWLKRGTLKGIACKNGWGKFLEGDLGRQTFLRKRVNRICIGAQTAMMARAAGLRGTTRAHRRGTDPTRCTVPTGHWIWVVGRGQEELMRPFMTRERRRKRREIRRRDGRWQRRRYQLRRCSYLLLYLFNQMFLREMPIRFLNSKFALEEVVYVACGSVPFSFWDGLTEDLLKIVEPYFQWICYNSPYSIYSPGNPFNQKEKRKVLYTAFTLVFPNEIT